MILFLSATSVYSSDRFVVSEHFVLTVSEDSTRGEGIQEGLPGAHLGLYAREQETERGMWFLSQIELSRFCAKCKY